MRTDVKPLIERKITGLDHADRDADQGLGRRPAAEHIHVEIQPDAEVACDERREHGVVRLIRQHSVDV
jgi:hypothetical protein